MARYEHLPLFKDAYDFNLYFFRLSRGFPKDIKYGLAMEVREQTSRLIDQIILANASSDRAACLAGAERSIELAKIKVRMLRDLGAVNVKSYGYASACLVGLSKQVAAWKAWSERNVESARG